MKSAWVYIDLVLLRERLRKRELVLNEIAWIAGLLSPFKRGSHRRLVLRISLLLRPLIPSGLTTHCIA